VVVVLEEEFTPLTTCEPVLPADASKVLRRFGIPDAPNPKNKEPPPINFMKSLLEKFAGMIQYTLM
jgi:hypothetical protein